MKLTVMVAGYLVWAAFALGVIIGISVFIFLVWKMLKYWAKH